MKRFISGYSESERQISDNKGKSGIYVRKISLVSSMVFAFSLLAIILPLRIASWQLTLPGKADTIESIPLPEITIPLTEKETTTNNTTWHPPHKVKVWTTSHKGRTFRVTQLPRCEHMEAVIAYNPKGETLGKAKKRLSGVSACSGSFHHPRSYSLADFAQNNGLVFASARTGRPFLVMREDGKIDIARDYSSVKGKSGVSALALGQKLVPLQRDGFSVAFMNRVTDRMAIGLNNNFIFIVQGKSDIWRLSSFMAKKLPCNTAINSDGGHVVRGKAPVHVVFRWKTGDSDPVLIAELERRGKIRKGI
ncbi:MAG: hypothetical protein ACYC27_20485 [Armatimonadota bacterium]